MKRKISLKVKLVTVIIGLITICTMVQGTLVKKIAGESLNEAVLKTVVTMTDKVANEFYIRNTEELRSLHNIASLKFMTDENLSTEQKCAQLVKIAQNSNGRYFNFAYYGPDGLTYIPERPGQPIDLSDRAYFKIPMTGKDYIGDPFVNNVTGQYTMFYGVPVMKDGKVIGVITSVNNGNFIEKITEGIDVGGGIHPGVMNMKTGQTIGNSNSETEKGNNIKDLDPETELGKVLGKAFSGKAGVDVFTDHVLKKKMIASYKPVGDESGWLVFCAAPYDFYFGSIERLNKILMIILVLSIALGAIVGIICISSLIRPLFYVKNSIAEIATGHADLSSGSLSRQMTKSEKLLMDSIPSLENFRQS